MVENMKQVKDIMVAMTVMASANDGSKDRTYDTVIAEAEDGAILIESSGQAEAFLKTNGGNQVYKIQITVDKK